jgi:hypothetical protein
MDRRRTPRMPSLNVTHHTLAKIKRIGLRHRKSHPTGSESHSHPSWNPQRFNLTVRCARAPDSQLESRGAPEQASIPTTRGGSFSARAIRVFRLTLRRVTNRAGPIQPNRAADVLAEVDAKHRDIHPFLLLTRRRAYDAGRRGGPHSIKLCGPASMIGPT